MPHYYVQPYFQLTGIVITKLHSSLALLLAYRLVNLKCCRYTYTVVAKKRNRVANKNETSGKKEFLMQIVNSNVDESMFTLVKG